MSEQDVFNIDTEAGLYAARTGSLRAFLWKTAAHQLEDGTDAPQAFRFCLPGKELSEGDHFLDPDFAKHEQVYFAGEVSRQEAARYMVESAASIEEMERVTDREVSEQVAHQQVEIASKP